MLPSEITLAIFEKYTPQELAETAAKMAQAQSEMEGAEAEKKISDGVFNERIKKHAAEVSELAQKYNKGGETAQIGCTIRYDIPTVGQKSYWRMDREEMVEVHDMTFGEKQQTIQFPLTAQAPQDVPMANEEARPEATPPPKPHEPAPTQEITFRELERIAVHIIKVPKEKRDDAIASMAKTISAQLLSQKTVIGPDGRTETVETQEIAEKLAQAWLTLAVENETKPKPAEEVTRICPYPGCILFSEHDGNHEFPKNTEPADKCSGGPEVQVQPETKPKRKRRPPAEPPHGHNANPGAPNA